MVVNNDIVSEYVVEDYVDGKQPAILETIVISSIAPPTTEKSDSHNHIPMDDIKDSLNSNEIYFFLILTICLLIVMFYFPRGTRKLKSNNNVNDKSWEDRISDLKSLNVSILIWYNSAYIINEVTTIVAHYKQVSEFSTLPNYKEKSNTNLVSNFNMLENIKSVINDILKTIHIHNTKSLYTEESIFLLSLQDRLNTQYHILEQSYVRLKWCLDNHDNIIESLERSINEKYVCIHHGYYSLLSYQICLIICNYYIYC
jgi:hypothetical protein